jgi:hypothetical protein
MANATVGIYLINSSVPAAETTADSTGHFIFRPEVIPMFPYTLKYKTAAGLSVQTSPSKFLAQNQKYIVENKINPYVASTSTNQAALTKAGLPTSVPTKAVSGSTQSSGGRGGGFTDGSNTSANASKSSTAAGVSNPILLVVLLLIVLVGGVGAGIVLYMKNKQPVVPPQQW